MPKMKTNRSVRKRVRVTGSGKVRRYSSGSGHLKSRKSNKRLRNFRQEKSMSKAFSKHVKMMLG